MAQSTSISRNELPRTRKQAVIVIHGIGEQRPMLTLANLVRTLVGERFGSKPDRATGDSELRRLRALVDGIKDDEGHRIETDFYELYWAHLVEDTKLTALIAWMRDLLKMPLRRSHAQRWRLLRLKLAGIGMVALAASVALWIAEVTIQMRHDGPDDPNWELVVAVVTASLVLAAKSIILNPLLSVVGDAARYLSPEPGNVAARQAIRHAGVELLTHLHEDRTIDRIVVVGHSLGSIIGYDVLNHYWALRHVGTPVQAATLQAISDAGIALCKADPRRNNDGVVDSGPYSPPSRWEEGKYRSAWAVFRIAQQDAFKSSRAYARKERVPVARAGVVGEQRDYRPWLISDFITAGSPLCYADFLYGGRDRLEQGQAMGGVPTAPPEPALDRDPAGADRVPSYGFKLHYSSRLYVYHHAAPFALTRWTNIYYPADPFSGPLRDLYGIAIDDHRLAGQHGEPRFWWRFNPAAHMRYWRTDAGPPLDQARAILANIIFEQGWPKPSSNEPLPRPRNLGGTGDGPPDRSSDRAVRPA